MSRDPRIDAYIAKAAPFARPVGDDEALARSAREQFGEALERGGEPASVEKGEK